MPFDFVADIAESAVDVASDIVESGQEFLADSFSELQEQVGDFAGDANWFDSTSFGDIIPADSTTLSSSFNFDSLSSSLPNVDGLTSSVSNSFSKGVDGLTDYAGSLADKAKDAASGAFDQIKDKSTTTFTNFTDQFTVKNIEAYATKTVKSLITQAEATAVNLAKSAANTALSTVVGPAAAATITGGVARSLTGPSTTSAKSVTPSSNPQAAQSDDIAKLNADGSVDLSQFNKGPTELPTNYTGEAVTLPAGVPASEVDKSAANVGYVTGQDPENGTYYVKNEQTGAIVASGLSEQQATLTAQDQTFVDAGDVPASVNAGSTAVNYQAPTAVSGGGLTVAYDDEGNLLPGYTLGANNIPTFIGKGFVEPATQALADAARAAALTAQAQLQQTVRTQRQNKAQSGDWRVRLRLAPNSNYLYNAPDCGPVLYPLRNTDGVIFPYTPAIDIGYKANYTQYDLTHSNYRGYFYQSSNIDGINVKATFTAQDTVEANYLLAVIHFFRSVTKMFYGQDAQRGSPPPLTYLSGLGDFQFNEHPCVVSQFNYSLPSDVNYIRAQSTVTTGGVNLLGARQRQTVLGNPLSYAIQRLSALGQGINPGALDSPFTSQGSLGAGNPTYVPTKMEISLVLLPMQSRSQISKQFSLKGFANGNLLKGGFW